MSSRRQKQAVAKTSAALEQLKRLREEGRKRLDEFELKVEDQIFDRLEEKDYALLVAKRRLESKDFVVGDDGLGYGDIGEEENWEVGGLPESSDEEDENARARRERKKASDAKRKDLPRKKERELMAAAALMGKQSVSNMFAAASGSGKTSKVGNFDDAVDNVLDDVLASIGNGTEKKKQCQQPTPREEQVTPFQMVNHTKDSQPVDMSTSPVDDMMAMDVEEQPVPPPATKHEVPPESSLDDAPASTNMDLDTSAATGIVKPEPVPFNAKIAAEPAMEQQARSAWQALRTGDGNVKHDHASEETDMLGTLPLDEQGKLSFYLIDAYEEAFGASSGTVFLFGKVLRAGKYISCCVAVRNIQRCIYAVPVPSVFPDDAINALEEEEGNNPEAQMNLKSKLQELAKGLKMELAEKLLEQNVSRFSMVPVKRAYAFENSDVKPGSQYLLKLAYSFKDPPLSSDLKGKHFSALFGTRTSALETFLIKRKVKGPCWLSISNAVHLQTSSMVSWCKLEIAVDSLKDIIVSSVALEVPRMIVASISLKTVINQKHNSNEIVSASVVFCQRVKVDAPMPQSEWNKNEMLEHFSIVRKLDGGVYPMGFSSDVQQLNNKCGSNVLSCESSERALLNRLLIKLHQLDPDVLLGHNISAFDLDVLLHRLQACKVSSSTWSRLGRLKRSQMPRLTGGGNQFGGGAGPGAMACVAGRLLCDTYLSSRELLKEVSYSLSQLTRSQLGRERKEIAPSDIPGMFQTSASLFELIESAETDAWLSLSLMFHLSILPLTRQLTNVSGNLWSKTLQGARAQRVEYLLLHEFHARKFILPDKNSSNKDSTKQKRKAARPDGIEELGFERDAESTGDAKRKKGAAYMGGLVLEPKKGLYDKYILLLDFNSLYPSIIQEYNICFTTVTRSTDGSIPPLPATDVPGVLPQVLRSLVDRRKQAKQLLKKTTDVLKYQQLDIQQQALKLTANSMYGCLGFPNSRFYAKSIAELITSQGREILQSTVDLVQNSMNLEVIYGDTDSIMINTGLDDISKAKSIAAQVIKEVNKRYKLLEIDLDGVFKRMLLLKKKKYACVKIDTSSDGKLRETIEQRGLDIVRRDWSLLSKEIGNFILEQILSGGSREDVVDAIHDQLRKLQDDMRNGKIELEKYVITKSLTKRPEDYPDSRNQPHVQVALRRNQQGHRCSAGDTVPYVICCQEGVIGVSLAERARHPDELRTDAGGWMVDIDYYLSQQIHPVVSRLCAPIEGTDPSHIANCLGLDASKFQQRSLSSTVDGEDALLSASILDDEDRYKRCEALELACQSCSSSYPFPGVLSLATKTESLLDTALRCPTCSAEQSLSVTAAKLANLVMDRSAQFIQRFYDCWMVCDDESCNHTTRDAVLRVAGDTEKGCVCANLRCNGRLVRQYTQTDLYNQLTHFFRLLDVDRALQKVPDGPSRVAMEKKLHMLRPLVDTAAHAINGIRDKCFFRWIQLSNLCIN